jgi:phage baseplate assembly protein W
MANTDINAAMLVDIAHVNGDMVRTASGDLDRISGLANLQIALFHRLVTVPGSHVFRPSYGVGIGAYQNGPMTFAVQQKIASLIVEQFSLDPRVLSVNSVEIDVADDRPDFMTIIVRLTPVGYTEQAMTFAPFSQGIAA